MLKYIVKRLLILPITLIALILLVFAITQLLTPVQRATLFVKDPRQLRNIPEIIKKYHLDESVFVQFQMWISEILQGNLGWSKTANKPVLTAILTKLPATLEVVMLSIPLTIFLGIFFGIKSAKHQDKPFDHATQTLSIVGYSMPAFWLGIILLAVFSAGLGWFPPERLGTSAFRVVTSPGWVTYSGLYTIDGLLNRQTWITLDAMRHLVLPTIVLTVCNIAIIVMVTRSSMLNIFEKRYMAVTRAEDLVQDETTRKRIRIRTLFPANTLFAVLFATMLTAVVLTETIFNIDGLGRWAAKAAITIDIPSVIGFTLFAGLVFAIVSFIVDIAYAFLDPRIR